MDLLSGTGVSTALRNVQWPKPFHTPAQQLQLHRGTWVGQDLTTQWCLRKLACCCSAEVLGDCRGTSCYQAESAGCFDQGQEPPGRRGCQLNWEGAQGNCLEPQVKQEMCKSPGLQVNFRGGRSLHWEFEDSGAGKEFPQGRRQEDCCWCPTPVQTISRQWSNQDNGQNNTWRHCSCPRAGRIPWSWLLESRKWISSPRFAISSGSSVK